LEEKLTGEWRGSAQLFERAPIWQAIFISVVGLMIV